MRLTSNTEVSSTRRRWKAAAPEWLFEQINFAVRRGAVVEDDLYNKLERLSV